jgi:hypothetical protein
MKKAPFGKNLAKSRYLAREQSRNEQNQAASFFGIIKEKDIIMEKKRQTNLITRSSLVIALALVIGLSVRAQTTESTEEMPPSQDKMTEGDQSMARQRHQIMEDMRVQDIKLMKAVVKMNSAPDDKKMALMADIVTQMVKQRAEMNSRMQEMQEQVMHYMIAMKGVNDKSANVPKGQK